MLVFWPGWLAAHFRRIAADATLVQAKVLYSSRTKTVLTQSPIRLKQHYHIGWVSLYCRKTFFMV